MSRSTPLRWSMLAALVFVIDAYVHVADAQISAGGVDKRQANTRAARNAAKANENKAAENPFPNATRVEPEAKTNSKMQRKIQKALDALYDEKYDEAEKVFNEILADGKAGNYEKALSYQALANIAQDRDEDDDKTFEYTRKAIDLNALPNVSHFGALLNLANLSMVTEKYEDAIAAIDRWLKESGAHKDTAYAIKAQSQYRLEQLDEAAATIKLAIANSEKPSEGWYQLLLTCYYEQDKFAEAMAEGEPILAKLPDSKAIVRLMGNIYINAEQPDKAVAVLSSAYQRGLLSTESEIKQIYQLYNYGERSQDAIKFINEAFASGKLPRSYEHLKALGDSHRLIDDSLGAATAYSEAAKSAPDGEAAFLAGYTYYDVDKFVEAKAAVQQALTKTPFKSEGQAWILLGNCELEMGNKQAAIAAYTKATAFDAVRQSAESWLKNVSRM